MRWPRSLQAQLALRLTVVLLVAAVVGVAALFHESNQTADTLRREELLQEVWGFTYGDIATVTVHVRCPREKIEVDPASSEHLMTVWGVGYRWDP